MINLVEPLEIHQDNRCQIVTINGVKYAYEFFTELGINGMAEGQKFQIVKREEGTLTIRRLD